MAGRREENFTPVFIHVINTIIKISSRNNHSAQNERP